ncbi:MAG: hypothetical protein LAO55_21450 [Acidobacteriia bacterium]|nr:hypothetical protein [Terriglobia bacterium]
MAMLVLGLLISALAFGETAPWQQGTVVSVQQGSFQPSPDYRCSTSPNGVNSSTACRAVNQVVPYWDVMVNLGNKVLLIRPYVMASGLLAVLRGANRQSLKDYVLPPGVSAGVSVNVAVFSNGTVTLQNGSGRNYSGEIVSQTLVPEEKPEPARVEPTISSRQITPVDQKNEFPWKQVDDPNQRWKFTIRYQFLFGELAMAPDRQKLGDFFAIDAKKKDDSFVGTARLRATVPAGTLTRTCEWTFAVELTSVTTDRIEGKMGDEVDQEGCEVLGKSQWGSAIWIRE